MTEPDGYLIEPEELAKLFRIAAQLCGGTDRERNAGNLLHVLCIDIERRPYNIPTNNRS